MRFDFTSIGYAVLVACLGLAYLHNEVTLDEMRTACAKSGGVLQKVDDSWRAERVCVRKAAVQ